MFVTGLDLGSRLTPPFVRTGITGIGVKYTNTISHTTRIENVLGSSKNSEAREGYDYDDDNTRVYVHFPLTSQPTFHFLHLHHHIYLLLVLALRFFSGGAQARHRHSHPRRHSHHHPHSHHYIFPFFTFCLTSLDRNGAGGSKEPRLS